MEEGFASFFHLWASLQSKIYKHLLYFSNIFGGSKLFFFSQSLWGVNRASTGNNTLVGWRSFTISRVRYQQEIKLKCLLRSPHWSGFALSFQENSSAHTPRMPGRTSMCWALSGFWSRSTKGIFLQSNKKKPQRSSAFTKNFHWWQGELISLEITVISECGGDQERTESSEENFPFLSNMPGPPAAAEDTGEKMAKDRNETTVPNE